MARLYSSSGAAMTPEFIVPTWNGGIGTTPDIAMAYDGSFVVVWRGADIDYTDGMGIINHQVKTLCENDNRLYEYYFEKLKKIDLN